MRKRKRKISKDTPSVKDTQITYSVKKEFWLSLKNTDVWLMKPEKSGRGRSHIAPFALELPYRLIKAYSYFTETILDPFLGSGTTLKAAATLGRNGVGYEINRDFGKIIDQSLQSVLKRGEIRWL